MKRILSALLCAAVLAGLLSGCGSQTDAPYVPTGDGLTWDDGSTVPTATQQEQQEQELTMVYYPDRSLNPYLCTDFTNRTLFSLLYQGLFAVDRSYNVVPILCDRYAMSEDMRTYTFYIADATFSDGVHLTAQDVAASLQAAADSAVYSGRFLHVTEIALSTDGGVIVRLDTACENLPLLLDIPILKQTELDADQPMGTGPYMLESTTGGPRLRRRIDWWCQADMAVTASSIPLVAAESPAQIRDAFEFEDVGLVCADPGSDNYADYRCDYELWDSENGIFLYLACNMDSKVFSNATVRAALTHAIDRDSLVEDYYRGFARAATLPASPQSPFYSQSLASRYAYDGVKFAQAVTAAGLRDNEVTLLVNKDDSLRLRVARAIAQMLTDCGLKVTVSEQSTKNYLAALSARNYDLYLGQTKLSPNMDLSSFFSGSGSLRYGGISDASMYALCLESLANKGNYYNLHQMIMEDGRLCPILFRSYAVYATRGLITGLTPARENVFYYTLGRTLADAQTAWKEPVPLETAVPDESA